MNILFILENYHPKIGGVETLFKNLVESLATQGHKCIVLTTRSNKNTPSISKDGNITIHRISTPSRYFFTIAALSKSIKLAKNCDLIHTTSYNAAIPAWIAAKINKKKIYITFHEVWENLWFKLPFQSLFSKFGHYLFEQLILSLPFDRYIAPSKSTATALENNHIPKEKIHHIYPGINYSEFFPFSNKTSANKIFIYTYYGRLGISKGLELILPAFKKINQENPNTKLQLIIPNKPKKIYKWILKYIKKNKLTNNIFIQNSLPFEALKQEIQNSNCILIPSYSEGFCYGAVETTSLGTPIISSDQAALKETVTGKAIKMKSQSITGLTQAMQSAYQDKWETIPKKEFTLTKSIDEHLKRYQTYTDL